MEFLAVFFFVISGLGFLLSYGVSRWSKDDMTHKIIERCFRDWNVTVKNNAPITEHRIQRERTSKLSNGFIDMGFWSTLGMYLLWAIGCKKKALSLIPNSEVFMDLADEN